MNFTLVFVWCCCCFICFILSCRFVLMFLFLIEDEYCWQFIIQIESNSLLCKNVMSTMQTIEPVKNVRGDWRGTERAKVIENVSQHNRKEKFKYPASHRVGKHEARIESQRNSGNAKKRKGSLTNDGKGRAGTKYLINSTKNNTTNSSSTNKITAEKISCSFLCAIQSEWEAKKFHIKLSMVSVFVALNIYIYRMCEQWTHARTHTHSHNTHRLSHHKNRFKRPYSTGFTMFYCAQ